MEISRLLDNLAAGKYDGSYTESEMNGVSSGLFIEHGIPVRYREGKSSKFFNGKENERIPGKRTEYRFETEGDKKEFLQKNGFIIDMFGAFPEVREYSKQYYENKKKNE